LKSTHFRKCFRAYELRLELLNTGKRDPAVRHLRRRQILREIERRFGNGLATLLKKLYKEVTDHRQLQHKWVGIFKVHIYLHKLKETTRWKFQYGGSKQFRQQKAN
jgi:hypothetical protein